jgi:excisionase family DNA binding protein
VGEHGPERDREQWLTLAEAAEVLGLSKDGVRMRVRRGTLRSVKGEDGRVYVFRSDLDADRDVDEPEVPVEASRELVEVLREQVEDLRARLDRETEANRENRRIIAGLIERVPELEPGSASEATEPPGSPQGAAEEADRVVETRPGTSSPQEASARPWWRKIFGS